MFYNQYNCEIESLEETIASMLSDQFSPTNILIQSDPLVQTSPSNSVGYVSDVTSPDCRAYVPNGTYSQYETYETTYPACNSQSDLNNADSYKNDPYISPTFQIYDSEQSFFPQSFNPAFFDQKTWEQGINYFIQETYHQFEISSKHSPLKTLGKATSSLKQRRASRSKCPCFKCCHARVNCIPSPEAHECMIEGCTKNYTRPAHLRAHLKSHENLVCGICEKNTANIESLYSHM